MNWSLLTQEWALLPQMMGAVLSNSVTLIALVAGGILGLIGGILPGISAVMAMTLMLGFVFRLPPDAGIGLLVGIYCAAIYGGSVTAIMLNIPGTPAAAATVLDGFPLAKKGRAREAIGIATWSSFFGEIGGELGTFLLLPIIAVAALRLGDWEVFLVSLIGVTLAGALGAKNPLKGWIAAFAGFLVAMAGTDPVWGVFRYGYTPELMRGIQFVPVLIGLFGLAEVFWVLREKVPYQLTGEPGRMVADLSLFKRYFTTLIRSILIGIGVGIVPGVGESVAPWVAYDAAQRSSREKEKFGTGHPEGIIAPEAANNATSGGALIPMLVLGIPGSGPTAVLLAALFMYGIRPGPMLIIEQPGLIARVIVLFWFSAVVFRLLSWLLSPYFIRLLSIRREIILPAAVTLGVIGAWGTGFTTFDVWVMFIFGVVGYLMRLRGYPLAPMVLGVLVGPIADYSLRRAILTYSGDMWTMFTRPIGLVLIAFLVIMLYANLRGRGRAEGAVESSGE
ncbi:MAG: tripartite tricarboxylate transporter permease [Firmicutes bacterium]|jgi:putative tricarboxylic transport membrane protein|nr:tripartite tricarboxylate transporter permease [Bacillota bacterium]